MSDAPHDNDTQHSEETLRLAAIGRGELDPTASVAAPAAAPADAEPAAPPARPDHVPEKFWDAEKGEVRIDDVLKSYAELEKLRGQTKAEDPPADAGEPEGGQNEPLAAQEEAAAAAIGPELFTGARDEYAQSGDLSAETREKIIAAGIDSDTLDIYLAGVKALEVKLAQDVYAAAGGEEAYNGAIAWAQKNWSQDQIDDFNAALTNPRLRNVAIKGLMAEAGAGNPGEGNLHQPGFAAGGGDLYTDKDEFLKDLAEADKNNDALARRKATQKLERSKKAGTLRHVTPRTGLSQFG